VDVSAATEDSYAYAIAELDDTQVYTLLSAAVQPRPIAWVATVDRHGTRNLAPFSFFNVASRNPPTLMVSIGERIGFPGRPKDTLVNIQQTGEFVVNIPSVANAEAVTASFATVEPEVDEFDLAGVSAIASRTVTPPSVAESLVSLECRLAQLIEIGTDTAVLGTVVAATTRHGAIDERLHADQSGGRWLSRLAGPYYATTTAAVHQIHGRAGNFR
jgi:flavin reductase (DIM6/NTAB) family NADH-FMN oxidoreductase RutF